MLILINFDSFVFTYLNISRLLQIFHFPIEVVLNSLMKFFFFIMTLTGQISLT